MLPFEQCLSPGRLTPRERAAIRLVACLQDDDIASDAGGVNQELVGQVEAGQDAKPVRVDAVVGSLRVEDRQVLVRVVLNRTHGDGAATEVWEGRRGGIARGFAVGVGRTEEPRPRDVSAKLHDRDPSRALRGPDALLLVELLAHRSAEAVHRGDRGEPDDHRDHQLNQRKSALSHA